MEKKYRTINKGRAPKCPKCGSDNTTLKEDDRDEWADLCILCFSCGYDEREIKHNNADTLKAWQKIADNRLKKETEIAELKGGITQALAERERILGIIEEEYKKHDDEKLCDCRATSAIDDILTRIKI